MLAERVERQKLNETVLFLRVRRGMPIKRTSKRLRARHPERRLDLAEDGTIRETLDG